MNVLRAYALSSFVGKYCYISWQKKNEQWSVKCNKIKKNNDNQLSLDKTLHILKWSSKCFTTGGGAYKMKKQNWEYASENWENNNNDINNKSVNKINSHFNTNTGNCSQKNFKLKFNI